MDVIVLDALPLRLEFNGLYQRLGLRKESDAAEDLQRLADRALAIARPKALYRAATVDAKGEDFAVLEGIKFTSRVLAVNFACAERVFPFVVTCGREIEEWSHTLTDVLEQSLARAIMEQALLSAVAGLQEDLEARYHPGQMAMMSPGSLADWPLTEQQGLFALLGRSESRIGVALTDSFFMTPPLTASGIRFPTAEKYENCLLCPREDCPLRRAKHDPGLYDRKYRRPE